MGANGTSTTTTTLATAVMIDRALLARMRETLRGVARRWVISPAAAQHDAALEIVELLLEAGRAVADFDELAALWGPVLAPSPPQQQKPSASTPAQSAVADGAAIQAALAPGKGEVVA